MPRYPRATALLVVPPLLFTGAVYHPVVRNYFFTDDFLHLYQLANGDAVRFLVMPHGGHLYLFRNALFFVTASLAGSTPTGYLWTAFLTHLANVGLLFGVLRLHTGNPWLACIGATLWGIAPFHEEAVGWYSVYGQVVATTLILCVLLDAGRLIATGRALTPRRTLLWIALMTLAANAFGTAIGVACAFPLLVRLLRVPGATMPAVQRRLWTLPAIVVALYLTTLGIYVGLYGVPAGAGVPGAGLGVRAIAIMITHLVGAGLTGLVVPVGLTRHTYPGLASWAVEGLLGAGFLWAAWRASPTDRRPMGAFLLLALASYFMVAIGRAPFYLQRQDTLAWAATVFRYHYLASVGLIAFAVAVAARAPIPSGTPRPAAAVCTLGILAILAIALEHRRPINNFATTRTETATILAAIRARIAAAAPGDTVYIENRPFPNLILVPEVQFPGWAALFIVFFPANTVDGHPVRFIARDEASWGATRVGGRIAELLLPPGTTPTADSGTP